MVKVCHCGNKIPYRVLVDGIWRGLGNRTRCLQCVPFGESVYSRKSAEEKRASRAQKQRGSYLRKKLHGRPLGWHCRARNRAYVLALIDSACQFCGYSRLARNLVFHHLRDKEFNLSSREFMFGLPKLTTELKKCCVCCHNCHGEIHDNLVPDEKVIVANATFCLKLKDLDGREWSDIFKSYLDGHEPQCLVT